MQGLNHVLFFPFFLFLLFFFFAKAVEQQVAISAASDSFVGNGGHLFCHAPPWLLQGIFFLLLPWSLQAVACHQNELLEAPQEVLQIALRSHFRHLCLCITLALLRFLGLFTYDT